MKVVTTFIGRFPEGVDLGQYQKTELDIRKQNADFLLTTVGTNLNNVIEIKNQEIIEYVKTNKIKHEILNAERPIYGVNKMGLKKLQEKFNWFTDF